MGRLYRGVIEYWRGLRGWMLEFGRPIAPGNPKGVFAKSRCTDLEKFSKSKMFKESSIPWLDWLQDAPPPGDSQRSSGVKLIH